MHEPRFAARVSSTTIVRAGIPTRAKMSSVIGTKVKRATSFVTNIELKNTRYVSSR